MIDHFILVEDSGQEEVHQTLALFKQASFEVIINPTPCGQMISIDKAYSRVQTPYIFHCEDDWLFTKPDFIKPSLTLLEKYPDFVQILIRDPKEEKHGLAQAPLKDYKQIRYRVADPNFHPIWGGYSFNPGLRRHSDYHKFKPFATLLNESSISAKSKEMGFRQAMLENGGVQHIGKHRHVPEKFWRRPQLFSRLHNSILKRTTGMPKPPDMKAPLPISCFIVAMNEADRIEAALTSVKNLADEIIVVDSGSSDNTVEIAKSYGAKTFYREWDGDGGQKRFAEEQCRNDWLLNIDADEWLELNLVWNIYKLFEKTEPNKAVYCLKRGDIYFGDRHLRWHMNLERVPRLYDKRKVRFTPITLHTSLPRLKGQTGVLDGILFHAHARKIGDMIQKEMNYARTGMRDKPLFTLLLRLFLDFPQCFLKHYILRRHIFGGKKGFIYSMVRGYVRFLRTAMELEKKLDWVEKETTRETRPPLQESEKSRYKPLPLTGYIISYNDVDRIGRALASLQCLTDKIIVIDSGSDDGTLEVARSYGAKIIKHDWAGFGPQKRFAEDQCSTDWVLNLDCDEWLNDRLIRSIRRLFEKGAPQESVFALARNDVYLGRVKNRSFMKRHYFLRLYNRKKVRFDKELVVEGVNYDLKKAKN